MVLWDQNGVESQSKSREAGGHRWAAIWVLEKRSAPGIKGRTNVEI